VVVIEHSAEALSPTHRLRWLSQDVGDGAPSRLMSQIG
jgi:hypothetical protein